MLYSAGAPAKASAIRPVGATFTSTLPTSPPKDDDPREGEPDVTDDVKPQVKFAARNGRASPNAVATVHPMTSTGNAMTSQHAPSDDVSAGRGRRTPKSALKTRRGDPRRQTISSSQPAAFEQTPRKSERASTAAGDLMTQVLACSTKLMFFSNV